MCSLRNSRSIYFVFPSNICDDNTLNITYRQVKKNSKNLPDVIYVQFIQVLLN